LGIRTSDGENIGAPFETKQALTSAAAGVSLS
jgi:hypothetical protein